MKLSQVKCVNSLSVFSYYSSKLTHFLHETSSRLKSPMVHSRIEDVRRTSIGKFILLIYNDFLPLVLVCKKLNMRTSPSLSFLTDYIPHSSWSTWYQWNNRLKEVALVVENAVKKVEANKPKNKEFRWLEKNPVGKYAFYKRCTSMHHTPRALLISSNYYSLQVDILKVTAINYS